jgi:hypothetical protein
MILNAVVFTGVASAVSFVAGVICPPRLWVAQETLRVALNTASKNCPPDISRRECKEMIKNSARKAFERFKIEEATPTSSAEYDLALSNAGRTAICLGCTIALGYLGKFVVKKVADRCQLPYSEAISRVVSAAFATLIAFYFMQSYAINTLQFVFLLIPLK